MEVIEAGAADYSRLFPDPYHVFNSADFNQLNESKCETIYYLLFKDNKYRLGLIAGVKDNSLYTPFSAPFGGFSFLKEDINISKIEKAVDTLIQFATEKAYQSIHYTMPPLFYNELFNSKLLNVFHRNLFSTSTVDVNYQFNLEKLDEEYEKNIWHNARKNLKISFKQNFHFVKCDTPESNLAAYNVIRENRHRKGFPLRMTYEQVEKTTKVVKADFFLLQKESENVAAAQVFHVAPRIVQVIYWGDIQDFAGFKPMNFLAYSVFKYYKEKGIKYVDIGPSSENGIPNYGLCEFKESIGCEITPKFSFIKSIA